MVKITKLTDVWKAEKIPKYVADSMEGQLLKLCKEYCVDDISDFGAFWYIESKADLDSFEQTGMTERIETAEPEWLTMLVGDNGEKCYQICHIICDSYAIYIFCEEKNFLPLVP